MRMSLKTGRRVLKHSLILGTTVLTCTALQAADQDDLGTSPRHHAGRNNNAQEETTHGAMSAGKFIQKALQGGQMEIQMGQLAQQKAENQEVKDLGAALVKDHTAADEQLQQLATKENVQVTANEKHNEQHKLTRLQNQTGAQFDKNFVRMAIRDHKKDIAEFEHARKQINDPDLNAFIDSTLPVLRKHLTMAESAARSVGLNVSQIGTEQGEELEGAGAAAPGVSGSAEQNTSNSSLDQQQRSSATGVVSPGSSGNQSQQDKTEPNNANGTINQNSPSGTLNQDNATTSPRADVEINSNTTTKKHKYFSTDKNDGKFLGLVPDPFNKNKANSDTSASGNAASSESGTSSSSSSSDTDTQR